MIHLMRKIKCKFTGSEEYQPEGVKRDQWFPVIGYEARKREKTIGDKTQWVEDIFYLITNEKGKIVTIASFNCQTMIDEKAEIDLKAALDLLRNVTIIGKVLSEKISAVTTEDNGTNNEKKG